MQKVKIKDYIYETGIHTEGRILSKKGKNINWLIDLRPALLNGEISKNIADHFWQLFKGEDNFHVAGMETAAIPLVTAIAIKAAELEKNVTGLIVRKERKKYGLGKMVEGE